jgi:mRNA interferase RelE/StbE
MNKKTTYLKNVVKTLESYDKLVRIRIIDAIDKIPQGDIKKMQGEKYPPLYRLRVGKYRIIYNFTEEEVIIVKIDTRGDVYK